RTSGICSLCKRATPVERNLSALPRSAYSQSAPLPRPSHHFNLSFTPGKAGKVIVDRCSSHSSLIEHYPRRACLITPYEIDAGNHSGSAGAGPMDSAVAPADWSCGGWPEIFGRSPFARPARQRSSPARVRTRAGQNAHGKNDGRLYSNRFSTLAIHARSFARGFDRHTHLQSAHGRIYDEARAPFFELNSGG